MLRALLIDDDPDTLELMAEAVEEEGVEVRTASSLADARARLEEELPDVVVSDLRLPDGNGMELVEELKDEPVDLVLVTGHATVETAVEALRQDVVDYLTKPLDLTRLRTVLGHLARTRRLRGMVGDLREELRELGHFGKLVGSSEPMRQVYDRIQKVAGTDTGVLLTGETGTGKELAAETIHELSGRREGPFVPLNCGAISTELIESELFGHERGAFTGADRQHRGVFERADGGTLFLDEVTEMSGDLQVRLLRVLESGRLVRVGGEEEIDIDVRAIAATNRDPGQAVEEGDLREDLYYRLKVFQIILPPLRERPDDLELLVEHFLRGLQDHDGGPRRISDEALELLRAHHWPGNVRELRNVIESASILADDVIRPADLPDEIRGESPARGPVVTVPVGSSIADAERELILATLDRYEGDKKRAAETLGISLKTLYNRLNSYDEEGAEA